jgi:hypothetical protein
LQEKLSDAEREKKKLEDSKVDLHRELQSTKELLEQVSSEQKLMIEYPDLNGPVNPDIGGNTTFHVALFLYFSLNAFLIIGTGDICQDMQNQVEANSLRIKVLEEQNAALRNSIMKILQVKQADSSADYSRSFSSAPIPLWNVHSATVRKPPPVDIVEEEEELEDIYRSVDSV